MKNQHATKHASRYGIYSERPQAETYEPDREAREARLKAITKRIRREDPLMQRKVK